MIRSVAIFITVTRILTASQAAEPVRDLTTREAPSNAIWLDSLDIRSVEQETGTAQAGKTIEKKPILLAGTEYAHGIGTHSHSEMEVDLHGSALQLLSMVGVDDEAHGKGSVNFELWGDDKKLATSAKMRGGKPPALLTADLKGVDRLVLIVTDGGDNISMDHADWAGAMIVLRPDAKEKPVGIVADPDSPPPPIASGSSPEPRIHAPSIVGTTPGRPFIFKIPATGEAPHVYSAAELPVGLRLDPSMGIITGTIPRIELGSVFNTRSDVKLTVNGPRGTATRTLTIVAGDHKLALTPPMGWNSWNVWGCAVDEAKVRAAADAMVSTGLAAHGFQYINIDDCWEGKRDANGEIQSNEKFPDMKALGDYIHSKGLRFGIYSSPGPKTCAGKVGSYKHEEQDARTWARWGVDYVKYDWCYYNAVIPPERTQAIREKPFRVLRDALDKCDRDIVFSICQYGAGDAWTWGAQAGGNLWRTTGDIVDHWFSVANIGFDQDKCAPYAGPGHWNDPDMLVVGKLGWGPKIRETSLTKNEQITHITLWSMLAAPLLLGCDLTQLEPFTIDLLTNDEVLAVDQDPLGKAAHLKSKIGTTQVWARPLSDGTLAVGLFNPGRRKATVTAKWSDLGLQGSQPVRDLWQQKDLKDADESFSAELPRHGAMLLKIGRPTQR